MGRLSTRQVVVLPLVLVGCCFGLLGEVQGLCSDMQGTCQERGRDVSFTLRDHPDDMFVHCQITTVIIECIEDYLCTCNLTITGTLDLTFTQTVNEYLTSCSNVSSHTPRTSTRLRCMEGKPVPTDVPDNPEEDLKVEDTISRADIEELDGRLVKSCEPYAHCSEVYHNAVQSAAFITSVPQRLAAFCLANRLNIVCMSDSFCACGEGNNELLHKAMDTILLSHEHNCQEQITEPILQCASSASLLVTPGLLLAALLQVAVIFL